MDEAGAGSLEQPAPSLPPGALWLEGKRVQDRATGGQDRGSRRERRRELGGWRNWEQKFVRPLCCRLPGTYPVLHREPLRWTTERGRQEHSTAMPSASLLASLARPGRESSLQAWAGGAGTASRQSA